MCVYEGNELYQVNKQELVCVFLSCMLSVTNMNNRCLCVRWFVFYMCAWPHPHLLILS